MVMVFIVKFETAAQKPSVEGARKVISKINEILNNIGTQFNGGVKY